MARIRRLDSTGDTKIEFDPFTTNDCKEALALWNSVVGKGGAAFRVSPGGEADEKLVEFSQIGTADEVVLVPAIVGG